MLLLFLACLALKHEEEASPSGSRRGLRLAACCNNELCKNIEIIFKKKTTYCTEAGPCMLVLVVDTLRHSLEVPQHLLEKICPYKNDIQFHACLSTRYYAHTSPAEFHEIVLLVQLERLLRPHLQGLRWLPGREASF